MPSTQPSSTPKMRTPRGLEVRYERSFLLDLRNLDSTVAKQMGQFVFNDFFEFTQLQDLPAFRQIGASNIFYRFTLERYLISLEVTGQIVKFLRILPKPEV